MRLLRNILLSFVVSAVAIVGFVHYTPSANFSQIRQSTVMLQIGDSGVCSGAYIKPQIILTAAHCDGGPIKVNGWNAVVLKKDVKKDLMLLYVGREGIPLAIAEKAAAVDSPVQAVGYPAGVGQMVTEGRIQGPVVEKDIKGYTLFSAPVAPGNSGGPIVRRNGLSYEIVGIVSAGYILPLGGMFPNMVYHIAFMVDADDINKFINE